MNKFEKLILSASLLKSDKLTQEEFEALLEIINATPNPTVCVELLCGVYENPTISKTPEKNMNYDNRSLFVLLDYNKFTNEVTYGYNKAPTKSCWTVKINALPTFDDITAEMEEYDSKIQAQRLGLTMDQFRADYVRMTIQGLPDLTTLHEDTCSLKQWQ